MSSEETKCSICLNTYNASSHRPKSLPCSHTFCKTCIQEIFDRVQPKCAICEEQIQKHDIIAITTNFTILELVENNTDLNDPIDTANQNTSPTSNNITRNRSEGDRCILRNSDVISSEDDSVSIDVVKMHLQEDLFAKFDAATLKSAQLREDLTQLYSTLGTSCEVTVKDVEADFDHLISMLTRRKKLLKQQTLDQYEEKLAEIEENLETVTLNSMRLESLQKHTERLMSENHSIQTLQHSASEIETEMNELQEPLQNIPLKKWNFRYDTGVDEQSVTRVIRCHGKVTCKAD